MIVKMYSVLDKVAMVFNRPFCEVNHAAACRAFDHSIKENPHPKDYELYYIADYNDGIGEVIPQTTVRIRTGIEVMQQFEGNDINLLKEQAS